MERWVGKIAVVTGAAGGIGLSLARALSENGMIVVGLDKKKQEMLDEIKNLGIGKGKFYALSCDVSDEDSVTEAFGWIKKNLGVVQVLLNNAGCMVLGGFADTTPEIWRNILDVNLMGSIHCATTAIKMMREANLEGHVINMNSIAGHRIYLHKNLYYNIYGVTKHGITGFTETLQRELMGQNIRVTSISPGIVRTGIMGTGEDMSTLNVPILEPKDIADSVIYILGTPQRVQIVELTIRPLGEDAS